MRSNARDDGRGDGSPGHDPRGGELLGAPEQYNYGSPAGLGGSAFTGRSQGAMGGVWSDSYSGGAGVRDDAARRGTHSGRGPRGYRRSDATIAEDIHERLTRHPEIDPSDVEVRVKAGEVTLTGAVDDRDTKYMIEEVIDEEVRGVLDIYNLVRVRRAPGRG